MLTKVKSFEASPSLDSGQSSLDGFIVPVTKKARNLAKWLEWVIMADLPFSFVDRERSKMFTCLEPICRNTFKKYFFLLLEKVKVKIKDALPRQFGIVFDGWSLGSEHYLAVFATWSPRPNIVKRALLSCYVQDDIDTTEYVSEIADSEKVFGLAAEDQYDCLVDVLMAYGYSEHDCRHMETFIQFLTGDNCSTNTKMAKQAQIPFIGCKSHLLNLDVQGFVGKETKSIKKRKQGDAASDALRAIVAQVDKLCGKLKSIKNAAILRSGGITTVPVRLFLKRDRLPSLDNATGYADAILIDVENTISNQESAYHSVDHVSPTSNCVERLFSMCKNTMTDRRQHMGPESLEGTVILRVNSELWLRSAPQIMQEVLNDEKVRAEAVKNGKALLDSPTISDVTADLFFE